MKTHGSSLPQAQDTLIQNIMSREVVTTRPEVSLESIVELMLSKGLSRIPVVDDGGRLVGILSKTDLIEREHADGDTHEEKASIPWRRGIAMSEQGMHVHESVGTVADVMKRSPITLKAGSTVALAAETMTRHQLHGLPVVSDDGKVVGMVSPLDITRWVAGLA